MKDQEFISYFGVVLASLVVISVVVFVIAYSLSADHRTMDDAMVQATKERIQPVSRVNTGSMPTAVKTTAAPAAQKADISPATLYQSVCQACHLTGVLESPKLTDKAAWTTRMKERDLNAMYQSVIQGRGNMPAKAGRVDLSDDALKATVDYMLEQAGVSY